MSARNTLQGLNTKAAFALCAAAIGIMAPAPAQAQPRDSDGDGLTDDEERRLGTNPNNRDTDDDGYSDYDELNRRYLTNIPADYRTSSRVRKCDPLVKDIIVELDYMRPKTVTYTFWRYRSTFATHGHKPRASVCKGLIDGFSRGRGYRVFIAVDEGVLHRDTVTTRNFRTIADPQRDFPDYYYGMFVDTCRARSGYSYRANNMFLVSDGSREFHSGRLAPFEGSRAALPFSVPFSTSNELLQSIIFMKELGHCLIDNANINLRAQHLLARPRIQRDGLHCPYPEDGCALSTSDLQRNLKNVSKALLVPSFGSRCWSAVRGVTFGLDNRGD
jgi:hypothetical protein